MEQSGLLLVTKSLMDLTTKVWLLIISTLIVFEKFIIYVYSQGGKAIKTVILIRGGRMKRCLGISTELSASLNNMETTLFHS